LGSWYNEPAENLRKRPVLLVFERKSYWLITTTGCIVTLAARHKLPTVYFQRIFVTSGGLISYGAHIVDQYRRAAGTSTASSRGARALYLGQTLFSMQTACACVASKWGSRGDFVKIQRRCPAARPVIARWCL
jgi:hypothetical protein